MGFMGIDLDGISKQISGSLESSPLLVRAVVALERMADAQERIAESVDPPNFEVGLGPTASKPADPELIAELRRKLGGGW